MRKKKLYFEKSLRAGEKKEKQPEQSGRGRMGTAFAKMITQPRQPSLFDDEAVRAIDAEDHRDLLELRKFDTALGVIRGGRPVVLNEIQERILLALCSLFTQDMDAPDIKAKIADIDGKPVRRTLNIGDISKMVYDGRRERERKSIATELQNMSTQYQAQVYERDGKLRVIYGPLINCVFDVPVIDGEDPDDDLVEVTFTKVFFHELDKNFFYITPAIFAELRLKENRFDLYRVLLKTLLRQSRFGRLRAAEKARAAENEAIQRKVSDDERASMIADAKREGLSYTVNVDNILQVTTTRYDSSREMKILFWKQLDKAVASFQRLGLLSTPGYSVEKGKRGQKKITFHLAEDYEDGGRILIKQKRKPRGKKQNKTK